MLVNEQKVAIEAMQPNGGSSSPDYYQDVLESIPLHKGILNLRSLLAQKTTMGNPIRRNFMPEEMYRISLSLPSCQLATFSLAAADTMSTPSIIKASSNVLKKIWTGTDNAFSQVFNSTN